MGRRELSKRTLGTLATLALGVAVAFVTTGCSIRTVSGPTPRPRPRPRPRPHHVNRPPAPPPVAPTAAPTLSSQSSFALALPPQPAKETPTASPIRAELLPDGTGAGRPPGFRPDAPPAYWIWQGPRGNWRLRTTTKRKAQTFRGVIHGVQGSIVRMQPSRNAFRDRIWPTDRTGGVNRAWAFSFATNDHADGFIFAADGNGCVRFDLKTDGGVGTPIQIFVGPKQIQPSGGHFTVCPRGVQPGQAPRIRRR